LKNRQQGEMSAKVSDNHIALDKKLYFASCVFSHVVQKQTLGEVENWMVVWWQVVSGIFIPKIIKIR